MEQFKANCDHDSCNAATTVQIWLNNQIMDPESDLAKELMKFVYGVAQAPDGHDGDPSIVEPFQEYVEYVEEHGSAPEHAGFVIRQMAWVVVMDQLRDNWERAAIAGILEGIVGDFLTRDINPN